MVWRVGHVFRSDTDVKRERIRDAFPELARLLTRRPARSAPWRDFWKVWLSAMAILIIVKALWDPVGSSLVEWIATIVGIVLVTASTSWLFRRLGLVGNRPA